jgi:hypothetical protein
MRIVWSDEAQKRLTVVPGTEAGRSASSAARRARFMPCRSCGKPQPIITSTTSSRGSSGTCFSAASIANAARSSGRASTSDPLRARPIGVRVAATMTASGMKCSFGRTDTRKVLSRLIAAEVGFARLCQARIKDNASGGSRHGARSAPDFRRPRQRRTLLSKLDR